MDRVDVTFSSGGLRCAGWLYRPDGRGTGPVPIVVLGHGLGANREMGLDKYARRFAEAGMAALAFDYRYFGASEGQPRQLLDIAAQRADWHAAIAYARSLDGIDPQRVALWGSSFGGGHVLSVAAADPTIAAVVSQCPFTDGLASALAMGPVTLTKVGVLGMLDTLGSLIGRGPLRVSLAGDRGDASLMAAPDVVAGYGRLAEESPHYEPTVAARVGLHILLDAPRRAAARLRMPVFYALCSDDTVAPVGRSEFAASRTARAVIHRYPVGHFDIYYDEPYETAVSDQIDFLVSVLQPDGR